MAKSPVENAFPSKPVLRLASTCAAAGLVADGLVCTIDGLIGDGGTGEAYAVLVTGAVGQTATKAHLVDVTFGGLPANGTHLRVRFDYSPYGFIFASRDGTAFGRVTSGGGTYPKLIGVTTGSINGAGTYTSRGLVHAGVANRYVGIRFPDGGGAGQQRYGWVELGNYVADTSIQVTSWGFEDAGKPAPLPVPEPSTVGLGLLALGAAGVSAYKRRRASERRGAAGSSTRSSVGR